MKPKFLISVPTVWMKRKGMVQFSDVTTFYDNLLIVLDKMSLSYECSDEIKTKLETDGIFLGHHTYIDSNNVWNIKKGYLNDYLYFDKTGYSGWSEMANNKKLFDESQKVDFDTAEKFFTNFAAKYTTQRESKIKQSETKFHVNGKYVFVAGQRPQDTVSKWAHIPTIELMGKVAKYFEGTEYIVVIKIHPGEKSKEKTAYKFLKKYKNVVLTDASIHDIIPGAAGVYTTNSGVGFESLLYLKSVFVSGHCDYQWAAASVLRSEEDIALTAHLLQESIDKKKIIKFMYYMLSEYFVNSKNHNSIQKKIERTIKEYNEIQNS